MICSMEDVQKKIGKNINGCYLSSTEILDGLLYRLYFSVSHIFFSKCILLLQSEEDNK